MQNEKEIGRSLDVSARWIKTGAENSVKSTGNCKRHRPISNLGDYSSSVGCNN